MKRRHPLSQKQRQAHQRVMPPPHVAQIAHVNTREQAQAGIPTSSWWLGLTREQLHEQAEQRKAEMLASKFGRQASNLPEYG